MGSKTTSTVSYPPPTEEEKALNALAVDAMMPVYMGELGYEITKKSSVMSDDPKYQSLQSELESAQSAYTSLQASSKGLAGQDPMVMMQLSNAQNKVSQVQNKISEFEKKWEPEIDWDYREKLTPELERIRAESGEDSEAYQAAYKEYQQNLEADFEQQQEISQMIMDKTEKFLRGDFSITPDQKNFIDQQFAPIREATNNLYSKVRSEVENTDKSLKDAMGEYEKRIRETGMSVGDALTTLGEQVKQTGMDMDKALTNTISVRSELLKMGIEDATGEITRNTAMNAAAVGRSPDDPEFQKQIQESVARQVKQGQLELGLAEAQGRMGIAERTGAGLEDVAMRRAALAERTGAGLEDAATRRAAIAERTGASMEGLEQARGEAELGLARDRANMEYQIGAGMPPSQISLGMDVNQYNQAIAQQRIANAAAAFQAPYGVAQGMQAYRQSQPTTTTTKSFGIGDILGGIVGLGTGAASAASGFSSAAAMRRAISPIASTAAQPMFTSGFQPIPPQGY